MKRILLATLIVMGCADASAQEAMGAAGIAAAKAAFSANSCGGCHETQSRAVGPSIREIAARYKGKKAGAAVAQRIRLGSQGRWGSVPHPVYEALDRKDATLLANWMLAGAP